MIALLQRVSRAAVTVNQNIVGSIDAGLLVLVGVQASDDAGCAHRLIDRILDYRVFNDDAGKMNRSLRDCRGGLLLVPQFTLAADTTKGLRPSFSAAAAPAEARVLFDTTLIYARSVYAPVAAGVFGADMAVELVNHGPVTFWLEVGCP